MPIPKMNTEIRMRIQNKTKQKNDLFSLNTLYKGLKQFDWQ